MPLTNLVENATKYASEDTTGQAERRMVHLTVGDGGLGIPRTEWEHVFEMFHRAATRDGVRLAC